jgi:hypothetical protein
LKNGPGHDRPSRGKEWKKLKETKSHVVAGVAAERAVALVVDRMVLIKTE